MTHIRDIELWAGGALPPTYIAFLTLGIELVLDHLVLYSADQVIEANETDEIREYLTGFVAIGHDNGCHALVVRVGVPECAVFLIDTGSLDPDLCRPVALDFEAWLAAGCPLSLSTHPAHPQQIDLYLVRVPSTGIAGVRHIQHALAIEGPVAELPLIVKSVPCRLATAAPYLPIVPRAWELNLSENCLGWFEVGRPDRPVSIEPWCWSTGA